MRAIAQPITAKYHGLKPELYALCCGNGSRRVIKKYPAEELYTSGLRIYTSLDSKLQKLPIYQYKRDFSTMTAATAIEEPKEIFNWTPTTPLPQQNRNLTLSTQLGHCVLR